MEIGGFFPYGKTVQDNNHYVDLVCPGAGDVKHLMSGRCAIYLCLQDSKLTDQKRVAYLPAYDCETVIACFVKAGYELYYYDVDENMVPRFKDEMLERISLILVTGYYGYTSYDTGFIDKCRTHNITIIQDLTHTAFSTAAVYPDTDYLAVSLRKWMGVASGGLAIKRRGAFQVTPIPADLKHLAIRDYALSMRKAYEEYGSEELNQKSSTAFWEAEWMLREIFDMQEGDSESLYTIHHYPLDEAIAKRCENYTWLLEHFPEISGIQPVFKELPTDTCPMFFAFYCDDRDILKEYLTANHIPPKIYWPVPPFFKVSDYPCAEYIYSHIMSISCDQRFSINDMKQVINIFEQFQNERK